MKKFKFLFLAIFVSFFIQKSFGQISAKDLKFTINNKNQIEILLINNNLLVEGLKITQISLDIFDKSGTYAGTIQLTDSKIKNDEISPDEKIKISYALLVDTKTGNKIEIKDKTLR